MAQRKLTVMIKFSNTHAAGVTVFRSNWSDDVARTADHRTPAGLHHHHCFIAGEADLSSWNEYRDQVQNIGGNSGGSGQVSGQGRCIGWQHAGRDEMVPENEDQRKNAAPASPTDLVLPHLQAFGGWHAQFFQQHHALLYTARMGDGMLVQL